MNDQSRLTHSRLYTIPSTTLSPLSNLPLYPIYHSVPSTTLSPLLLYPFYHSFPSTTLSSPPLYPLHRCIPSTTLSPLPLHPLYHSIPSTTLSPPPFHPFLLLHYSPYPSTTSSRHRLQHSIPATLPLPVRDLYYNSIPSPPLSPPSAPPPPLFHHAFHLPIHLLYFTRSSTLSLLQFYPIHNFTPSFVSISTTPLPRCPVHSTIYTQPYLVTEPSNRKQLYFNRSL